MITGKGIRYAFYMITYLKPQKRLLKSPKNLVM